MRSSLDHSQAVMANYSYQSSSFSSGGGADSAFQQADANNDGRVDLGEFRNFVGQ
jgi:Ca2+-binding EF-hand superfamily protein